MDQTGKADFLNIFIASGVFGALAGALMSFVVNIWSDWNRRKGLHRNLLLEPQRKSGCRVTARIHNGYVLPMSHVYAYITIEHDPTDVLHPPSGYKVYIKPDDHKFEEDRLCWSMAGNLAHVDIYAGEKQPLDVVEIDPRGDWIQIPSECGWGIGDGISRVFLKMKKYNAAIKIVSKDTKAKEFELQIDPFNNAMPLSLRSKKPARSSK
jgi:hypothetical protein